MDLSESQTREEHIDPLLKEAGWFNKYIKKEVNSISSKFKIGKFEYYSKDSPGRFIDYLLIWEDNTPLAIIEAKRFSLDPEKGIIQATTYQKDVQVQTGYPVPIFLTNGRKWYLKEKNYPMREVAGPFSQRDLKRKYDLFRNRKDLSKIEINTDLVDRSKGIEVTRRILEHLNSGHRKALIGMATGTGKTRVAIAIIESLIRAKHIQNILFVVDRITLGRNAFYKGFQKFLHSEPSCLLNEQKFESGKRIYVSTVQTLMAKNSEGGFYFQKFGPGFFDLIIFDEAHRSYYDRQNLVMKYFDALNIGLTATPSKSEAKNTYDLFECERGKPTVEYSYDEAVKDGVLAPYDAQVIETKVLGLGIKGLELDKELKTDLIKQDEDPEYFEVPGTKFVKYFTDEKTNALIVSEFMNRCYKSYEGKPCKTIFFCINVKHAEALRETFKKLYPNIAANDVEVIVSKYDRYMDAVERFQKDSSPRIALSVGVLDTGIDIPEVCNLVFVTPVFSYIRFWQMVGRGTRNKSAVIGNNPNNLKWLPVFDGIHDKKDFKILDFKFGEHSNVREHKLETTDNKKISEDIRIKIFERELELLKKKLSNEEKNIIERRIIEKVSTIDQQSFIVKPYVKSIKKIISKPYNLEEHITNLKKEIAPLLKFSVFGDGRVQTFILHCTDLFKYVKESNLEAIDKEKDFILERIENVWATNFEAIKKKTEDIMKVLQEKFWEELTFEDIDFLIREIAPLMIFYEKERKSPIRVNAPDFILNVEQSKMEIKENPDFEKFKQNSLVKKMIKEGVTWKELLHISEELSKLNSQWTIENIQKNQDFVLFLRNILEISDLPDPEEEIKRQFDNLIIVKNKEYNGDQINFLRVLASFFAMNKHLEKKDLVSYPIADERPLEKFKPEQLDVIIRQAEKIIIR
jgi:type I restriction enzyme R subunit